MFSPYYRWRRGRGPADPFRHACVHVALYGRPGRWAMTERRIDPAVRGRDHLVIGGSSLSWDGQMLRISLDERGTPLPRRIRGEIRIHPQALTGFSAPIDHAGLHRWRPIAPRARVEVALAAPSLHWTGEGYLDSNDGDAPLERDFARWTWSRASFRDHVRLFYDTEPRQGGERCLALSVDAQGRVSEAALPPCVALARSAWRLRRFTRADPGEAHVRKGLLDAPFYARALLETRISGESALAMHESLDLDRFAAMTTQLMLPFRVRRNFARTAKSERF